MESQALNEGVSPAMEAGQMDGPLATGDEPGRLLDQPLEQFCRDLLAGENGAVVCLLLGLL